MGSEGYMIEDTKVVAVSDSWMFLRDSKSLWAELFENWIWFWVYYIPVAMILDYFANSRHVFGGVFLLLPIFFMILIKRKVKKLYKFLGGNLLVIIMVYILAPFILDKVFFTLIMVIYFIYCFKQRYDEVENILGFSSFYFSGGFLIICFIVAFNLNLSFSMAFISFAAFNVALSCAIYINLTRTQKLLEWEVLYAAKFLDKIRKMKLTITTTLILIVTVINLVFWKTGVYAFFDFLQQSLNSFFVMDKNNAAEQPPKVPNTKPTSDDSMADMLNKLSGDQKENIFLSLLVKVIEIGIVIICIVIFMYIIWMVYLKLKELYKQFYAKSEDKDIKRELVLPIDNLTDIITEKFEIIKKDIADILEVSNRKRIRTTYQKIIKKYSKMGIEVKYYNTPNELEQKVYNKLDKNIEEATSIYEKARYSNYECNENEVKKIKKYL